MPLSPEDVRKVALLARLELTDDEVVRQAKNLNNLMAQFDALLQVDVEGIEPTAHAISMVNVMRPDVARPSLPREEVLANAPEARDGVFIVPRILGD